MNELIINDKIFGYKTLEDLQAISQLVKSLGEYSKIVELGASLGNVTWNISKNVPYGSIIYAIDVWDDFSLEPVNPQWCKNYFEGVSCSLDDFLNNIKDCDNVVPIKTNSPPEKWEHGMVDMVIIDIDYNPEFYVSVKENIDFWMKYLKPNGIMCGYNWAPASKNNADNLKLHYRIPVREAAIKYNKEIYNDGKTWWWIYK